jgi:hypothetical protein
MRWLKQDEGFSNWRVEGKVEVVYWRLVPRQEAGRRFPFRLEFRFSA